MIDPNKDDIVPVTVEDLATEDTDLVHHLRFYSYLSRSHRLLYVSTPKVACTTLKWWFASLEGYAKAVHDATDSNQSDPELAIHDLSLRVAPQVTGLELQELAEPLTSESYFRFAVVRNPYKRIFSAWQSKLMLREPLQIGPYVNSAFFHHPINGAGDVAGAFEAFLEHLAANETPNFWDLHWAPQFDVLRPDLINYSKIGKIEQASEIGTAILQWVGPRAPNPFAVRRANESLIPYQPEFLTDRSVDLISSLYAADFDAFGYERRRPDTRETFSSDQMLVALQSIGLIRGRHRQLGERSARIQSLKAEISARDVAMQLLRQTQAAHDEQVAALNGTVEARDEENAGRIRERDDELLLLREKLLERDASLSDALSTLERAAADARAAGLEQPLATRDAALAVATDNLGQSDRHAGALQRDLRERDAELVRVSGLIEQRDSDLMQLREQVAALGLAAEDRDREVSNFQNAVAERDATIAHLTNEAARRLIDKDNKIRSLQRELHQLQQSISGRLTLPVRLPGLGVPWKKTAADHVSASVLHRGLERIFRSANRKIRASSLFDADYYRNTYPDLRDGNLDLATHYYFHGWREHRNPSALFNTAQYLADNPDVEASGINPLVHYIKHGRREGRLLTPAPTPVTPPNVAITWQEAAPVEDLPVYPGISAEELQGDMEAIDASGKFDAQYYVSMYAELGLTSDQALRHFCESGWQQGRNPSDEFDTTFYLETYHDISNWGKNPFWHYIVAGYNEGRHALPHQSTRYERDVRFGAINPTIKLLARYTAPDWGQVRAAKPMFKEHESP